MGGQQGLRYGLKSLWAHCSGGVELTSAHTAASAFNAVERRQFGTVLLGVWSQTLPSMACLRSGVSDLPCPHCDRRKRHLWAGGRTAWLPGRAC